MPGRTTSESTTRPTRGDFLFIEHHPESHQTTTSRGVTSFTRKWQSSQKRQNLRVFAQQDATYARSLVGWQSRAAHQPLLLQAQPSAKEHVESSSSNSQSFTVMSLQPTAGLRMDPFNSLPVDRSTGVVSVVDYCTYSTQTMFLPFENLSGLLIIHVWAPLAITHFDTLIGYNTYLGLCWPLALQDDMLFSATLACTRAAWCLSQGLLPENDRLHLHYRGLAMSKLRLRLSDNAPINTQSFLFTVDYMLSVSYMWKDDKALDIHLSAFRNIAQGYLATNKANDVMSSVVAHRMKSWQALDKYRKKTDVFRQRLQAQSSHQAVQPTYIWKTLSLRHIQTLATSSPALRQLCDLGLLSMELVDVLVCLRHIIDNASEGLEGRAIASITRQLKMTLLAEPVSDLDIQVGYALIGLCYYLDPAFSTKTAHRVGSLLYPQSNGPDEYHDLDAVAQTYINRKLTLCLHDSHIGRRCALWSSIMLGSILLQTGRGIDTNRPLSSDMLSEHGLKSKGHIILAATATRLAFDTGIAIHSQHPAEPSKEKRPPPEPDFEQLGRELIGTAGLCEMWRHSWRNTIRRQREWKEKGQLRVGNPAGLDDDEDKKASTEVEYMVLMEARESFPVIAPPDHPSVEAGEEREIVRSFVKNRDVHLPSYP